MKVDVNQILKDLKGDNLKDPTGKELSVEDVICTALNANFDDEKLKHNEKMERFRLMIKCSNQSLPVDITVKEAATIQDLVAKVWSVLVVGRVDEILNKKDETAPKKKKDE